MHKKVISQGSNLLRHFHRGDIRNYYEVIAVLYGVSVKFLCFLTAIQITFKVAVSRGGGEVVI